MLLIRLIYSELGSGVNKKGSNILQYSELTTKCLILLGLFVCPVWKLELILDN